MHNVHPETIPLPEHNDLDWDESGYNDHSRNQPYLSEKTSQERKIHDDAINRLSHIRQHAHGVHPEAIPLPDDNEFDMDVIPMQTSNNDFKTLTNSKRVQFKRKKNNTLNYRIVPEDEEKSLIKSTDFKTVPSSVASSIWISTPRKNQFAYKKFKKYTQSKKHLLDGSFKKI